MLGQRRIESLQVASKIPGGLGRLRIRDSMFRHFPPEAYFDLLVRIASAVDFPLIFGKYLQRRRFFSDHEFRE